MDHLRNISFKELRGASVSFLISADVPELFCVMNSRKGLLGIPVAIETPLGWSLLGPSLSPFFRTNCNVNFIWKQNNDDLQLLVNQLWDTDFQKGIIILDMPNSSVDRQVFHKMKTSITITSDEHYQLPFLWKEECPVLPQSLKMAEKRLSSL